MLEYEKISENCKIKWIEDFNVENLKYTQVSGYIFNIEKKLLIVKSGENWTIPGGHIEKGETKEQTLEREVMEEACCSIDRINYLGAVEVIENDETYYQLRYLAFTNVEYEFVDKWETTERKFVDLEELPKYIKWANGVAFKAQIETAKNLLNKMR